MLNREQQALAEWLQQHPYELFATWTFGKRWPVGPTLTAVQHHVLRWTEEQSIQNAFVVAERGTSGQRRWHAHGLLGQLGSLRLPLEGENLWRDWSVRYGRCSFDTLHPETGVTHYVSKYCAKGFSENWWVTNNGMWV